ncbi:MAG: GNAT family N-acetyltransferase [Rhodobacteraceae bacterium]|nr:GNAT family N-acetyltransferase [Paracoccaceae bacterium]
MTLAPTITTDRLILRAPCGDDIAAITQFFAQERARFYGGPLPEDQAWRRLATYAGQWMLLGYGLFTITLKETGEPIGMAGPVHPCDFSEPELSWLLTSTAYEGHGFAAEACKAVLTYLFDRLGWSTVVSYIDPENLGSKALATRLGAVIDAQAAIPACLPGCVAYRHFPAGAQK